ncbi:TonB-dependent receptor [uncultured Parabacteroides sp.]|uniref:TonB-dependent receptor n=1 Tax=uncultured Parabacteroides sp. TaxID=512312 RepID=UPI00259BA1DB|nr:TonB-dependent receptor [uncultured Parabacteroides sp.]
MKLSTFLLACSMGVTQAAGTYAQKAIVSIEMRNETVKEILDEIEEQSEFSFFFNIKHVDLQRRVSVVADKSDIFKVLDVVFAGTNVRYSVVDKKIILSTGQEVQQNIQKKNITGVVKDQNGEPVTGANVVEKGTTNGTITDIDGKFSLQIDDKAILQVSFIGYVDQTVAVKGKSLLELTLKEDAQKLDEVVVTGYGVQKKASLTGSISSLKMDDELKTLSSSNMTSVLAGTMAGLKVNTRTGVPGTSAEMSIRTSGSWNSTPPVYVIDGVVREKADFDRLDVNEVDNISILKDAASAAIYGSRSSGGVVLVTTRRGQTGKPQIRYTGSYAVEARGMEMERTTGIETAELANYIHRNRTNSAYYWDDAELEHMRNINGGKGYDVIDEYWQSPMSTHHSLGLSGGSEKVKYFINGSYFGQTGFLEKMDYSRYNIRANLEAAVNKNLKVITQVSSSYGNTNSISYGKSSDMAGIYTHMRCIQPEMPARADDGRPVDWGWIGNIGEFSNEENSGYNKDENQVTETLIRLEYDVPFIKGLKAKGQFAYSYENYYNKTFNKKQTLYQVERDGTNGHIWRTDKVIGVTQSSEPGKEYIYQESNRNKGYQLNLQLDYARTFGKHDLAVLAVYEQKEAWVRKFNGGRENFPILIKDQWFATSGSREDSYVDGEESESGRISYIGQVNYGYDNRYLLNASLRVDGSMNFAKGNQYGYFPAVSAAWVVSNESFFKSDKVDQLKLRTSVGLTGNDNIIGWQWQESYQSGKSSYLGTSPSNNPGIKFGGVVNPNVTWEKSLSYNVGVDLYFMQNFSLSTDFWYKKTYDILGERVLSIPTSFGFTMPKENYGEVHAKGLDIEVGYRNKVRDFNYYVKGVFSWSANKVKVKDYAAGAPDYDIPINRSLDYLVGYRDAGIIRTQADLDNLNNYYKGLYGDNHEYTVFGNKAELGMLIYKDLSGPQGKPDGKIDSYDRDIIAKHTTPPFTAGLTLGFEWRGFSFETLLQGDFGYERYLDSRYLSMNEWNRMPRKWLDHWSLDNPNGYFPDPKAADEFKSYNQVSTFTSYDASFVKLRYINLGYALPKKALDYIKVVNNARIFFSATNLFTITSFDFWDPELGGTGSYPNMKTFNFGIDVTF